MGKRAPQERIGRGGIGQDDDEGPQVTAAKPHQRAEPAGTDQRHADAEHEAAERDGKNGAARRQIGCFQRRKQPGQDKRLGPQKRDGEGKAKDLHAPPIPTLQRILDGPERAEPGAADQKAEDHANHQPGERRDER
jgi:hypothetical protein